MKEKPFFSIVIAVSDEESDLDITLDSIAQQQGVDVEAVVIDASLFDQSIVVAQRHQPVVTKISSMLKFHRYKMYNRGLQLAEGKYVLFVSPGDFFLSQYALQGLKELIEKTSFPEVVLGSGILYDIQDNKRKISVPASLQRLKRGHLPTDFCASCFQVSTLVKMGGFKARWKIRGGFELFCRISQKKDCRFVMTTRVLTDHKFKVPTVDRYVGYNLETPRIIARYFGWFEAMIYFMTHNYFLIFKYWIKNLRFSEK